MAGRQQPLSPSPRSRLPLAAIASVLMACGVFAALFWVTQDRRPPVPAARQIAAPAPPPARAPAAPAAMAVPAPAPPPPAAVAQPAGMMPRVITPEDGDSGTHTILSGLVRVADGDSLEMGRMRIRLIGIDAPELFQPCRDRAGVLVACGQQARAALEALVRAGPVSCTPLGSDRYDRVLARCGNGQQEINRAMVLLGWALAYDGDATYAAEERAAAAARVGMHALQFDRPSAWRRAHPR